MGTVMVIGAGTMGSGIAQVAAAHGWRVWLRDVDEATAEAGIALVRRRFDRLREKGRLTAEAAAEAGRRLYATAPPPPPPEMVIEAVVEDEAVKARAVAAVLPLLPGPLMLATNTSSLSVSRLGRAFGRPDRTVGMHFFNPAPLLKLVEVVAGEETDPAVVDRAAAIAEGWGKTVARARDLPGFIVNHVARPYYLEAFRLLEEGHGTVDQIDGAMKDLGGFRMGPFELTDLIGQDVNAATTRSVWDRLGRPPLLAPSPLQEGLVARGELGRKSGRGAYDYGQDPPRPALAPDRAAAPPPAALQGAVDRFVLAATGAAGEARAGYIFARILAALFVQARHALACGVAEAADIDTALRAGVNYPQGPFQWSRRIGQERCAALLEQLQRQGTGSRYAHAYHCPRRPD